MSSFQKGCVHLFYSQEGRDKLSLSWAKALQFTVKQRAGSSRQAIEYDYNNKNKKQFPMWSQNWLPPCNNFPLSKPIPQSCGKREWQPFCLVRWIFLGLSTIFASVSSIEICLLFDPLLESVYFTPVDLDMLNFKFTRQHFKWTNLALFYVWNDARVRTHWYYFLGMYLSHLGPVILHSQFPQGSP